MGASRARRVAQVIGQLTRGGAERQLALLVRHLDSARFVPTVYCVSAAAEPFGSEIAAGGVAVKVLRGSPVSRVWQLRRCLAADRIDLVHAWLYLGNAYAGCAHLLDRGRPLITTARNCKVQARWPNVAAFRSSQAIVANSRDVEAYVVRHYWAPPQRIRVIYNAVDVERFHPPGSAGAPRGMSGPIVTIGRLVPQKNHELFLEAAGCLARQADDARFVIVGEGPLKPALEARAQALGIADRVTFAGERGNVEEILRTASLFWLTSRWEGMPNVVLEAMASGVPVIAADVGGTRELIRSGTDGFVVTEQDASGFARLSRELLQDEGRRCRFAAAARARAEEFSTAHMVAAVSQLYECVLDRGV